MSTISTCCPPTNAVSGNGPRIEYPVRGPFRLITTRVKQMHFSRIVCALVLAVTLSSTACVTQPRHRPHSSSCGIQSQGTLGISTNRIEMAPGESRQLPRPVLFMAPYLPPDTLSTDCVVRWSVASGGTIDASGLLTVARDARPGSTVEVRSYADTLVARQDVHVIDPAPNPLAATWSQSTPPAAGPSSNGSASRGRSVLKLG